MSMRRKARDGAGLLSDDVQQIIVKFTNLALRILKGHDRASRANNYDFDKVQQELDRGSDNL